MKTVFTIILLVFAKLNQAQTDPLPFPTDAIWQMSGQFVAGSEFDTYAYHINGTTNVNDTIYYQVETFSYCGENIPITPMMLIREDSGRWYGRYNEIDTEELFFDFTLEVGESVALKACSDFFTNPQLLVVTAIEEITMYDGSSRRMWTLVYDDTSILAGNTEYWIEGMGNANIGLVHPLTLTCVDLSGWIRCYFEGDVRKFPFYEFPVGVDCCNTVGISDQLSKGFISLYPNPTTTELTIQSPTPISLIEISDLAGRIMYKSQPNSILVNVHTELLTTGFYFLSATTEHRNIETVKFLKD